MTPLLSLLVIVHDMPRQAMNTLYSVSAAYQRGVSPADYEVIVVENASDRNLDEAEITSLEGDFRYLRRQEAGVSPARAINVGLSRCRGEFVGLMIDGARMVTPGVVRYALEGFSILRHALVAVPGYHLGRRPHHLHSSAGYDEEVEQELLRSVGWRSNGYSLFEVACVGNASPRGVFHPFLESNCMFASREAFREIGGADERFQLPGGGSLNLHMYRRLGRRPGSRLIVLPGEGSFHQFHGGVTTREAGDRRSMLRDHQAQLEEIWEGTLQGLRREPMMLGAVPEQAMWILEWSAGCEIQRHRRMRRHGLDEWPDESDGRAGSRLRTKGGTPSQA